MRVRLLGATLSPTCAAFSLRQFARDFGGGDDPVVLSTIDQCISDDHCLPSVPDVETCTVLVDFLRSLVAKAGFGLAKRFDNSA